LAASAEVNVSFGATADKPLYHLIGPGEGIVSAGVGLGNLVALLANLPAKIVQHLITRQHLRNTGIWLATLANALAFSLAW